MQPAAAPARPRVRLFNVKFSPNLGDGLLSECLEQALIEHGAHAGTWSVDLAARTGWSMPSQGRSLQMRLLGSLPAPVRQTAVRLPLAIESRRKWGPHYGSALEDADCVVIGGGNLLADHDLNFPTKLRLTIAQAAAKGLPVFIYGCGVSDGWSRRGKQMLHEMLACGAVRKVFLRDARSAQIWAELTDGATALAATVVRDPGLLAASRYGLMRRPATSTAPTAGINVTSQLALHYHSSNALDGKALTNWYIGLAERLYAQGFSPVLFTNGSPEDRAAARALLPLVSAALPGAKVSLEEPAAPEELVHLIASLDCMAAFRMHAVIAAYAAMIPFVALAWDPKLDAFMQSTGLEHRLCDPRQSGPEHAAANLLDAHTAGFPVAQRDRIVAEAQRDVSLLFEAIRSELRI